MNNNLTFIHNLEVSTETEGAETGTKLPIGVQDFESLRQGSYLYVDKTRYIYNLVHSNSGKQFFLSRPRRFGKSLFVSSLMAYWQGKQELFAGLELEQLESGNHEAWRKYPVFYFDFNKDDYNRDGALEDVLDEHLRKWETHYKCHVKGSSLAERFRNVVENATDETGLKAVILVDEYDKPLLDVINDREKQEHNKSVFKGFFSTLKSYDKFLQFVFVTGVTRFSKVSIFSDLNHLQDISMDREYATICGVTEKELSVYFGKELIGLAKVNDLEMEACKEKLKNTYDGYHFHAKADGVYNPFSIMNAFSQGDFGEYWFGSGTPTFLVEQLKNINYDIRLFTSSDFFVSPIELTDYMQDDSNPLPLLYQAGYLTIKGYDGKYDSFRLGYPNDEVKYAFLETLLPYYLDRNKGGTPLDIRGFDRDIEQGNIDGVMNRIKALIARIPYPNDSKLIEWSYQIVIYLVFTLLGKYSQAEIHTNKGRIDCVVETNIYVFIFEFKLDKSADDAGLQIEDRHYADIYLADARKVYEIGVNFDSDLRNIKDWELIKRPCD